ncbi:MAG: hypothetical protein EZS28_016770 [Streblomastix strix]|uniref:Uncharacterized protein n=1 Tax=Streblomastix strix TaxID=222440 RepID=A0A5J4VYG5_9EUKA|nr:MAG: hypothetical protein EZS28_016770 [Streblomastix strix]
MLTQQGNSPQNQQLTNLLSQLQELGQFLTNLQNGTVQDKIANELQNSITLNFLSENLKDRARYSALLQLYTQEMNICDDNTLVEQLYQLINNCSNEQCQNVLSQRLNVLCKQPQFSRCHAIQSAVDSLIEKDVTAQFNCFNLIYDIIMAGFIPDRQSCITQYLQHKYEQGEQNASECLDLLNKQQQQQNEIHEKKIKQMLEQRLNNQVKNVNDKQEENGHIETINPMFEHTEYNSKQLMDSCKVLISGGKPQSTLILINPRENLLKMNIQITTALQLLTKAEMKKGIKSKATELQSVRIGIGKKREKDIFGRTFLLGQSKNTIALVQQFGELRIVKNGYEVHEFLKANEQIPNDVDDGYIQNQSPDTESNSDQEVIYHDARKRNIAQQTHSVFNGSIKREDIVSIYLLQEGKIATSLFKINETYVPFAIRGIPKDYCIGVGGLDLNTQYRLLSCTQFASHSAIARQIADFSNSPQCFKHQFKEKR